MCKFSSRAFRNSVVGELKRQKNVEKLKMSMFGCDKNEIKLINEIMKNAECYQDDETGFFMAVSLYMRDIGLDPDDNDDNEKLYDKICEIALSRFY